MRSLQCVRVIDPVDPLRRMRVQVQWPDAPDVLAWAEACLPPGILTLPREGDDVWVASAGGTLVWLGVRPRGEP
mgnify:CR=1 FL=1